MFFRSIALLIVSIGAFVQGFMRLGKPAQAVEKSGWLYQNFGDQGVAYGLMALGVLAFIPGLIWFNQSWIRAIRMRFQENKRARPD
ncbi:hypothetical protein ACLBWS_04505 [Brucellaceae bacterium D45D]